MKTNLFTESDIEQIKDKGQTLAEVEVQINNFREGFPFLKIINTATIEKGITLMPSISENKYLQEWENYCKTDKTIVKFVPASGAASRMFKDLFEFLESQDESQNTFIKTFFDNFSKFAFYSDLDEACKKRHSKDITTLILENKHKLIIETLLSKVGLNYGNLPKGLLKFHSYESISRTPIEEHLSEGSLYAKNSKNLVNIHFTVSPEHQHLFETLINNKKDEYEKELNSKFNITFSQQKSKTDTIAVDMNNNPFRENDKLVFRPGGHGALIENLNDIDADIVFLKNIDNVIPDKHKNEEVKFKKALAGYLIAIQKNIFDYLNILDSANYDRDSLLNILYFIQEKLNIKNPETKYLEDGELVVYLKNKLNRPIRICGMVSNIGEPGGGPFFTINPDSTVSLQILESSQIDLSKPENDEMFKKGTHFNPVDLVCAIKDYKNQKFDLKKHIDKKTGFISKKSKNGKDLKALELPGLWNGSMSDWNTIFVEVPLSTFNPVKTVNDLLRIEHQ